jgi:hypothetical protein
MLQVRNGVLNTVSRFSLLNLQALSIPSFPTSRLFLEVSIWKIDYYWQVVYGTRTAQIPPVRSFRRRVIFCLSDWVLFLVSTTFSGQLQLIYSTIRPRFMASLSPIAFKNSIICNKSKHELRLVEGDSTVATARPRGQRLCLPFFRQKRRCPSNHTAICYPEFAERLRLQELRASPCALPIETLPHQQPVNRTPPFSTPKTRSRCANLPTWLTISGRQRPPSFHALSPTSAVSLISTLPQAWPHQNTWRHQNNWRQKPPNLFD